MEPTYILVVDDEPEILDMTRAVLSKHQFQVTTAAHGRLALKEIETKRPDVILLDVLMPEMDGYTFYKELKNNPLTADIPVLIVTGRGKMEDSFKVLGVDGFIAKPFTPALLLEQIHAVLDVARARHHICAGKPGGLKILAVGPQPRVTENMAAQGCKAGCAVTVAATGADAIAKAVTGLPDMVFIDIQLDDMPADESVQILRRLPHLDGKPIIGYCYYDTEKMAQAEVRKKVLDIEEAGRKFLSGGGTDYIGRYSQAAFIKCLVNHLKPSS